MYPIPRIDLKVVTVIMIRHLCYISPKPSSYHALPPGKETPVIPVALILNTPQLSIASIPCENSFIHIYVYVYVCTYIFRDHSFTRGRGCLSIIRVNVLCRELSDGWAEGGLGISSQEMARKGAQILQLDVPEMPEGLQ